MFHHTMMQVTIAIAEGAGGAEKRKGAEGAGAGAAPSSKRAAKDTTAREQGLHDLIVQWESKVLELAGKDAVGAADAKIEQHDAEAKLAGLQGDQEGVYKAEMAKSKAEMAKAKAEMAKAKAEMAKAKAEMAKAKEGTEAHTMAKREYERAEAEYEAAQKVHAVLVEQVTGGGYVQGDSQSFFLWCVEWLLTLLPHGRRI
jgi:multidrug resistance efflux pump